MYLSLVQLLRQVLITFHVTPINIDTFLQSYTLYYIDEFDQISIPNELIK